MKGIFKYIGISSILVFSFYYTQKINDVLITNSELFNEIKMESQNYKSDYVNAIIDGDYIIPGINGLEVNVFDSYYNMKDINVFSEMYLEYDEAIPAISIQDNRDKIINKGNSKKNSVSLIIKDNEDVINYLKGLSIEFSRLVDYETYDSKETYEQINNETKNYKKLERKLKNQVDICVINNTNKELCRNNNKFLVKETLTLNNHNISSVKNEIDSGSIIYIDDNVNVVDFKILLRQIYYKDLGIVKLSKLINEERD